MTNRACACWPFTIAAIALSACGTIGEKDFACPGRPAGVRCMSASEVYAATHHSGVVEPTSTRALGDEPESAESRRARVRRASATIPSRGRHKSSEPSPVPPPAHPPVLSVNRPLPIRTPAQVMRVWIAPWEDVRGVLHGGEHVFIEIVERRWSVGEREASEPVRFFSLQAPADAAQKATQASKSAKAPNSAAHTDPSPDRHLSPQGVSR